ncbi:MAG: hypothetical protein ACRCVL_04610, partial [Cetobacterium sp.]
RKLLKERQSTWVVIPSCPFKLEPAPVVGQTGAEKCIGVPKIMEAEATIGTLAPEKKHLFCPKDWLGQSARLKSLLQGKTAIVF